MCNQRNHFISEYTCNQLLLCDTCMFPLVAVPHQRYLVLISIYYTRVYFVLQE